MSKIYILAVYDDTPYRQGVEYWFDNNLNDLVDYMISQWDWMESSELNISVATIGVKGFATIWHDWEIKSLVDDDGIFKMTSEEIIARHPGLPEANGDLYICRECEVIYLDKKICDYCGEKCCSGDEKCYDDKREKKNEL